MIIPGLSWQLYELASAPQEKRSADDFEVVRDFWMPGGTAARRYAAERALLGYAKVQTDPATGRRFLSRVPPFGYPAVYDEDLNPGEVPIAYCRSTGTGSPCARPTGAPGGLSEALGWKWEGVSFKCVPFYVRTDVQVQADTGPLSGLADEGRALERGWHDYSRFVSRWIEPGIRTITLKSGYLVVEATGLPAGEGISLTQFAGSVKYCWDSVPTDCYPAAAVARSLGRVNDARFDNFDPQTLLLTSVKVEPRASPFGPTRYVQVEYTMGYRPNQARVALADGTFPNRGWNYFLATVEQPGGRRVMDYYRVVDDPGPGAAAQPPFLSVPFADLFRPPQP